MRYIYNRNWIIIIVSLQILFSLILPITVASNPPTVEWGRVYGGKEYDTARDHVQTIDGGYAIVGITSSIGSGGQDFWLIKTDKNGTIEWNKVYGGAGEDFAFAIEQTSDGGLVLAGSTTSFDINGDYDFLLIKTNKSGEVVWYKTYGGLDDDYATCLVRTSDKGFIIAGITNTSDNGNDLLLIKIDDNGTVKWFTTYGGKKEEKIWSLIQTSDNGFLMAGSTSSFGEGANDIWIIRTDQNGTMLWNRTYGGNDEDSAQSIIQTQDNGFAIAGETKSFGSGSYDVWLIKIDQNGSMLWNRTYGGKGEDSAQSFIQTTDGGYAVGGFSEHTLHYNFYLVKTDLNGYAQWKTTHHGGNDEKAFSLIQTNDSNYCMAGHSESRLGVDYFILKTNNSKVSEDNLFPIANAGSDIVVSSGTRLSFNGSGFDPDGEIIWYNWDFNGDGVYDFTSNSTGNTSHIYEDPGVYYAYLEVIDINGSQTIDLREITVQKIDKTSAFQEFSEKNWFCIGVISFLLLCMVILVIVKKNSKKNFFFIEKYSYLRINRWCYLLVFSFLLITLAKFLFSCSIKSPWIYFDEPSYGIIASNIFNGELTLVGNTFLTHPYPTGYPFLISASYLAGDNMEVVYHLMLLINCLMSSLIIFPVFAIMKKFIDVKLSFYTSLLIATLPTILLYNFLLMSENALFLIFIISCFLIIKVFDFNECNWKFVIYCLLLGCFITIMMLIKVTAVAMLGAVICTFLYKFVKNRHVSFIKYAMIFIPLVPFVLYLTVAGQGSILGYELSRVVSKISIILSDFSQFLNFFHVIINEISYFTIMSYILFISLVLFLILKWRNLSFKRKESLSTFMVFGLTSIFFLIILTATLISYGSYPIYTRYVSIGLPIIFMLGIIGWKILQQNKKINVLFNFIFILFCFFFIITFPKEITKIVNNLDIIWVPFLNTFSYGDINGFSILLIIIGIISISLTYLLIYNIFFTKKIFSIMKKTKTNHFIIIILIISLLLFYPIGLTILEKNDIAEDRSLNAPAKWLMTNDPSATVVMEDRYGAFSGGGMSPTYWKYMYADMKFWFPNGNVLVGNKESLSLLLLSEKNEIDYILSTHDLTEYRPSIEDFNMEVTPLKRQDTVDWHLYKIN